MPHGKHSGLYSTESNRKNASRHICPDACRPLDAYHRARTGSAAPERLHHGHGNRFLRYKVFNRQCGNYRFSGSSVCCTISRNSFASSGNRLPRAPGHHRSRTCSRRGRPRPDPRKRRRPSAPSRTDDRRSNRTRFRGRILYSRNSLSPARQVGDGGSWNVVPSSSTLIPD